jgi:hypothetical protein
VLGTQRESGWLIRLALLAIISGCPFVCLRSAGRGHLVFEAGDPRFSSAGQRQRIFANASLGRFCAALSMLPTRMDAAGGGEVVWVCGFGAEDRAPTEPYHE